MANRKSSQIKADKNYDLKAPIVSFRLPIEYYEQVEQLATQQGIKKADAFRQLIIQSIDKKGQGGQNV